MNILIDVSSLAWPLDTGIPRFVTGLAAGLQRLTSSRHELTWACVSTHRVRADAGTLVGRSVRIPVPYRLMERLAFPSLRRYDLYHAPAQESALSFLASRTIVTVHDVGPLVVPHLYPSDLRTRWKRLASKLPRTTDMFVTDTNVIREELVDALGIDSQRVRVIYPGVDERFFETAEPDPGVGRYLMFAGAATPRKDLKTLLKAFEIVAADADLRDLVLVVAGAQGWRPDRSIPSAIVGRVRLLGHLPFTELRAVMRGARALVVPSLYEGFGYPVAEAMACGRPTIVAAIPALIETAGGAALTFPPGDAESLAEQIRRILGDQHLHQALSQLGRSRAEDFRWSTAAEETLRAYDELN